MCTESGVGTDLARRLAAAGPTLERMTLPSGIPIDELDPGIRPQDDLFRHVNGRWLARTEIPADRARYGTFQILAEESEKAVREIVEQAASAPAGSEERNFGVLYAGFMDAERAEQPPPTSYGSSPQLGSESGSERNTAAVKRGYPAERLDLRAPTGQP
jgi:Peptidase family M13